MNDSFKANSWQVCHEKLPSKLYAHQLNIFEGRIILTGGCIGNLGQTNKAWEGNISFEPEFRIKWIPLPPILESRMYHTTVVI